MGNDRIRNLGRRHFIVELQPYRDRTDFVVRRRTWRGHERSDQVLQVGSLNYTAGVEQPRDLIRDLRRIADVLERRYQSPSREAAPEPPGGGYGGQPQLPGFQPLDHVISPGGGGLDTGPSR